jgi:cyclase
MRPGTAPDCVTVLLREDRVLFASDAVLPIPVLGDGDWRQVVQSLQHITTLELENIVQGHGEVILRGEIAKALELQIDYIHVIRKKLSDLIDKKRPPRNIAQNHARKHWAQPGLLRRFGGRFALAQPRADVR